nr:transposase [Marinoscillum furvescens]
MKDIILNSLTFLSKNNRVYIYGFVIMNHHIHLIWQMREGFSTSSVQRDFLKFTAQKIKFYLIEHNPGILNRFEVGASDRKHQIWQRQSLSIPLYSEQVFQQKLDYIHNNPVEAGLCSYPWEYVYSSYSFYNTSESRFDFLRHHCG